MLPNLWFALETAWRFRDYRRKKVTPTAVLRWLNQFDAADHRCLRNLVRRINYIPEGDLAKHLVAAYQKLTAFLKESEFSKQQVIFLSFDQAGSSSSTMLNLLRDEAHLEAQKFNILDARDIDQLANLTFTLGEGALVYVDDFIGSGKQVSDNIRFVRPVIQGNFVEAVLAVCICEEATRVLDEIGVRTQSEFVHLIRERPLHPETVDFPPQDKDRLVELCKVVAPPTGLGFRRMATMVVLSRNTPNNCPAIFRGTKGQNPYQGILPRTTDLSVPAELQY